MNSVPPRLRSDLEIKAQPAIDGPAYVVKEPISGSFFRLREAEHFIASQFDGQTSLEVIRERAEAKFGASLSSDTLSTFVRTLSKARLLETAGADAADAAGRSEAGSARAGKAGAPRGGIVHGTALYLRFKLCDPDRLLARMAPRLDFLYTPWFFLISGALILMALGTTIANRYELAEEIQGIARLAALPFIVIVLFALVSVHEFAHGLTCNRFGGEVHEMGFMLLYFQPALYCNVSDAWLFPEKRQRLWVGFSGPYVELTLWAMATLLWRLTDPQTIVHGVALVIAGGAGLKTLLNFNPLLKFDGYYLVSDLLEVPNLRSKSFAYIGARLRKLFGRPAERILDVTQREKRIFLSYGLAAVLFSYSTLVFAILIVGDYFIESRGPLAIALACVLLVAKARRKIGRLLGPKAGAPAWRSAFVASSKPAAASGHAASDHAAPRRDGPVAAGSPASPPSAVWRWLLYAGAAAAALAVVFLARVELRIAGPFNVLPKENADVRSPLEEIIDDIYVDEGQIVKPGDPIARLDDRPLLAELAGTDAAIEEARAILRKLEAGATSAEIDVVRASVAKDQDSSMYASRRVERLEVLFGQGLVSQKELEDAQAVAAAAATQRTETKSRLHLLQVGTRPEEIAATKARIEQLEARRKYLEDQRALLDIRSPVAGIVATPTRQLRELRRQLVRKGDLVLKIYDVSTVTAQIFVSERELDGIEVGRRVELRARAYPGRTFHGTVTAIATSAQGSEGTVAQPGVFTSGSANPNKSVLVTTLIDNRSLLLKPEMTGQAKIFCGARTIADLIARRLALTFKVALWSWW